MTYLSHLEVQLAELDILFAFDKFCKEHELKYSLAGGTLLGAIRHKGFIPWDDDIDVMMPRPDYEKFKTLLTKEKLSDHLLLANKTKKALYPFVKIVDTNIIVERSGLDDVQNLWIDVFPVDGLPSDQKKVRKIYRKNQFYIKVICFSMWKTVKDYHGKRSKFMAWLISVFVKLYGVERANRNLERLAKRYPYGTTPFMGIVVWGMYGPGERMPISGFQKCEDVMFEGKSFKAVSCWNEYLTGIYGDYMQLPPPEKRVSHGIQAYYCKTNEE